VDLAAEVVAEDGKYRVDDEVGKSVIGAQLGVSLSTCDSDAGC
jgi:hypothetical protein